MVFIITIGFDNQFITLLGGLDYSVDDKLQIIASYYFLEAKGVTDIIKFKHLFKTETDKYIKDKKSEFNADLVELESLIIDFLNAVNTKYLGMKSKFTS